MEYIFSIITLGGINVIMVAGMAILTGYTGLFSMGHAGFMTIGAYTAIIAYKYLGVPFLLTLVLSGIAAMLSSVLVGYPSVRSKLKGDHFAIAMLGFGEAVRLVVSNTKPIINGALGIGGIPKLTTLLVVLVVDVIGIVFLRNFAVSAYGRSCVAIREQEVAAEIMGINTVKIKMFSLMTSAFYVGVGGGLFVFYMTFISPAMIASSKSSDLLMAVVFGGVSSLSGPILAAFVLSILPELLRFFASWRLVIYGILIVIVMLYKPEGLFGYKEISPGMMKSWWRRLKDGLSKRSGEPR